MKEIIELYLKEYFVSPFPEILAELITVSGVASTIIFILNLIYKIFLTRKNNYDLKPYYSNAALKNSKRKYIRTKCQNIDPSNEIEIDNNFAFAVREDLLGFFLKNVFKIKNPENKYYLILGDAGMGKTTFLLNLFRLYNRNILNVIFNRKKIKLLPLGENYEILVEVIRSISDKQNTILLLDALDESNLFLDKKNKKHPEYFDKLLSNTNEFAIVIITCRTNFFINEKTEPFELKIKKFNTNGNGFHTMKKMYLSPFNKKDVNKYINKSFQIWELEKKEKAKNIISSTKDIFFRPMLLSYIHDLVHLNKDKFLKFDVYEALIESWINRESNKYPLEERMIFKHNLYYFTYELAIFIYKNYSTNGYFISFEDAFKIAKKNNINLNELEIRSRTLLNRNSNGDYKFSHKTILECVLAYFAFISRKMLDENHYIISYDLETFDFAKDLINELQLNYKYSFKLPNIMDYSDNSNKKMSKIFKARYNNKQLSIEWTSSSTYKIIVK